MDLNGSRRLYLFMAALQSLIQINKRIRLKLVETGPIIYSGRPR
jgi:hypothetical protein